ncbi:MAG: ATP-dependent endonuclease, partial [Flavobacteriales bacterium]|nr:ATP-dependent endonuclease [Flavobacteriales bacterium]
GDPAQLPPVGETLSPALDVSILRDRHDLLAGAVELTEVVRQQALSGILANATELRSQLAVEPPDVRFSTNGVDVVRIEGPDLEDELSTAFARYGEEEVCVLCRSNKRAYEYARQVRARILGLEEEVSAGDRLMIVRNNYFWAGQEGRAELMANGELVEVLRVQGTEEKHGLRFADLEVRW